MTFYSLNPYHVLTAINSCGDLPIAFGHEYNQFDHFP